MLKLVHLDQAASFHPLLPMGQCFLFLVVTVSLLVPIITSMPWVLYVGKSIASFGSYNDFDIMLESYR